MSYSKYSRPWCQQGIGPRTPCGYRNPQMLKSLTQTSVSVDVEPMNTEADCTRQLWKLQINNSHHSPLFKKLIFSCANIYLMKMWWGFFVCLFLSKKWWVKLFLTSELSFPVLFPLSFIPSASSVCWAVSRWGTGKAIEPLNTWWLCLTEGHLGDFMPDTVYTALLYSLGMLLTLIHKAGLLKCEVWE